MWTEARSRAQAKARAFALEIVAAALEIATVLRANVAELLTLVAIVIGWILITKGIADLTSAVAWPISIGLLLLSLSGWKLVYRLFVEGLYQLTREDA